MEQIQQQIERLSGILEMAEKQEQRIKMSLDHNSMLDRMHFETDDLTISRRALWRLKSSYKKELEVLNKLSRNI